MQKIFLVICLPLLTGFALQAQQSDFIILKKKNNRTLKTYASGSFIMAETSSGFVLNGYIEDIRNDSIYIHQEETKLMNKGFGMELDTIRYSIGLPVSQIMRYYYQGYNWGGRKKGFVQVTLPRLMMLGGFGYTALELVNTAYRKESITSNNKPVALGTAAAIGLAGLIWKNWGEHRKNANSGKYRVVYVKAAGNK
jgi:hypothetical protein